MNSAEVARRWTSFLASRHEISNSEFLLDHFDRGVITRLCACGCNSYDLVVRPDTDSTTLLPARNRGGCVLSIAFHLRDRPGSIELDVFVDELGYLAGIDVSCNGNSEPVPEDPQMSDQPYHVNGPLALETAGALGS
jgi:hypothetical protein